MPAKNTKELITWRGNAEHSHPTLNTMDAELPAVVKGLESGEEEVNGSYTLDINILLG